MDITYIKGPLGYSVLFDGEPVGSIKERGVFWQVSIIGFAPGIGDGKHHTFLTLRAAKEAIANAQGKGE